MLAERSDGAIVNLDRVEKIAEAVLYEGYMLYPYRPSAVKNQQRWNFGVLCPQSYCERNRFGIEHHADRVPAQNLAIHAAHGEGSVSAHRSAPDRQMRVALTTARREMDLLTAWRWMGAPISPGRKPWNAIVHLRCPRSRVPCSRAHHAIQFPGR